MKTDRGADGPQNKSREDNSRAGIGVAPLTLEGSSVLHQMFRIRRDAIGKIPGQEMLAIAAQAAETIAEMERREDGQSAAFAELGHKGDLMLIHFRRTFDELAQAEAAIAKLPVGEFLEQTNSYLSMVEIGLYEATVRLHRKLAADGVAVDSDDGRKAVADAIAENREKLGGRLWPRVPDRRYVADPAHGGSNHNRGAAVDVGLATPGGRMAPMPSRFDEFGPRSKHGAPSSPEALENVDLLRQAMEKAGFKPLAEEWWHYDDAAAAKSETLDLTFEEVEKSL